MTVRTWKTHLSVKGDYRQRQFKSEFYQTPEGQQVFVIHHRAPPEEPGELGWTLVFGFQGRGRLTCTKNMCCSVLEEWWGVGKTSRSCWLSSLLTPHKRSNTAESWSSWSQTLNKTWNITGEMRRQARLLLRGWKPVKKGFLTSDLLKICV